MRDIIAWLVVVVVAVGFGVDCLDCPNHCFCYMWEGLVKTDCVRRNLINTFLGISHRTQILDLSHNVISILHGNEFSDANLRQLQDLSLSHNQLHKIDKFSFNGLHFLTNLDLSFNSIEYLNPTTFRYNPNLKTLNVSFNPLVLKKDEPFLSHSPSLQVLDMANCRLEFVSPGTFSNLLNLRVLNVSCNHIRMLQLSEGMPNLKYLDVSKNDLPCNDQTKALLQYLEGRKIQFPEFCQTSQKMIPMVETGETTRADADLYRRDNKNATRTAQQRRSLLDDVAFFFQSIPSFYAIVCGIQVGVFIGSFSTYVCLKKSKQSNGETAAARNRHGDSSFALIPLRTPPGTPPSPYRSRFFPSSFSLSAT